MLSSSRSGAVSSQYRRFSRPNSQRARLQLAKLVGNQIGNNIKNYMRGRKRGADRKVKPRSTFAGELPVHNEGVGGQYTELIQHIPTSYVKENLQTLAPQSWVTNAAGQLLVTQGKQATTNMLAMGGASAYANVSGGSKNQRYVLERADGELYMANNFLANVKITIYDCIARKDISQSAVYAPYSAWNTGLTDMGLPITAQNVGATPFDSDTFNCFWKVLKRTEIILAGGACHRHKVTLKGSKLVTGPEGYYYNVYKDTTYYCMVTISGQPAHDGTTKTTVGLGSGGIDYIESTEHRWKQLSNATQSIGRTDGLTGITLTTEKEVIVGGSAAQTNAEA